MKRKRCKVCGRRLKLDKGLRYEVTFIPAGIKALVESPMTYEAFDCLYCGCQNIVGVREVMINEPVSTSD